MNKSIVYITLAFAFVLFFPMYASAQENQQLHFRAQLLGENEIPPLDVSSSGTFTMVFGTTLDSADFVLRVSGGVPVTEAHLYCGTSDENGSRVATIFGSMPGGVKGEGVLAEFTLSDENILPEGENCTTPVRTLSDVHTQAKDGSIYVNVHTTLHPDGGLRGVVKTLTDAELGDILERLDRAQDYAGERTERTKAELDERFERIRKGVVEIYEGEI